MLPGPSRRQANVEPATVALNANVDVAPVLAESIEVSGAAEAPTVTVRPKDWPDWLRAMSVARAVYVRFPVATPESARDHVPSEATASVPRDPPFSNSSSVMPGSPVPVRVKLVATPAPSAGVVMTGGSGARVSTRTTTIGDDPDEPEASRAVAVRRWSPSLIAIAVDHEPEPEAVVVPLRTESTKTSTVAFGAAPPLTSSVEEAVQLYELGDVIAGAAGAAAAVATHASASAASATSDPNARTHARTRKRALRQKVTSRSPLWRVHAPNPAARCFFDTRATMRGPPLDNLVA